MPVQCLCSALEHWIVACLFLCPPKDPNLLWIVAALREIQGCWFGSYNYDCRIRTAWFYLWARALTWLGQAVRSEIERTVVLRTLSSGHITVIYNWLFIVLKRVVANGSLLNQSLEKSHWMIKAKFKMERANLIMGTITLFTIRCDRFIVLCLLCQIKGSIHSQGT